MQAPKNGFFYVIDRETGELISTEPYARVSWASRIDANSGRPVENPGVRYHGKPMFEIWPGVRGAHSWLPQSFSPRTGLVYIPVIESASIIGDEGLDLSAPNIGPGVVLDPNPDLPGARQSYLKAWDPAAQRARWIVKLPGDWPGGTMASAGDLVFQGRIDGAFIAYHALTGKALWSFAADAPIVAPPITYAARGKQFVTVLTGSGASGGGMFSPGLAAYATDYRLPRRVLTFALDGKSMLPNATKILLTKLDDADLRPDAQLEGKGAQAYAAGTCLICHGPDAIGGGTAPDLRGSPYILSRQAFESVVRGGALVERGMP